jgi:hypothetical protein
MKTETLLPKTLTFPSGIVMVQDAFEYWKSYMIFPNKEKNFTEYLQKQIDAGNVGKR